MAPVTDRHVSECEQTGGGVPDRLVGFRGSRNRPMATATDLKAQIAGLPEADKVSALISAGYVRPNGKADFVAFYEQVLAERAGRDPISEKTETMAHFVNKWAAEYDARDLKLAWETYSEQASIDGKFDAIDEFIDDFGLRNIEFYEHFADTMNDYDRDAVLAFVWEFGISSISHFAESYQGTYKSEAEFAEEFISQIGGEIPPYVMVDWQATWDCGLRYDYSFDDETGAVFLSNF